MFHDIKDDFLREITTSEIKEESIHLHKVKKQGASIQIRNPNIYF
jgi:hypothetical protein